MVAPLGINFWGTRGLISSPSRERAMFGGNTPCIQILHHDHLILVDTGFGVSNLGEILLERILQNRETLEIYIFYTHFHWDHIQGLPFFQPIYFSKTKLHLFFPGPVDSMVANLDVLFDGSYSPFSGIKSMPSHIEFHSLSDPLLLHGLKIEYCPVDHVTDKGVISSHAFAYKMTSPEDHTICIATDHEARDSALNNQLIDFCKDCNLLVHDAQFTQKEYKSKVNWGHSSIDQALSNASKMNAEQVLLTHHYPARSDREIQKIFKDMLKKKAFQHLDFEFAREGVDYQAVKAIPSAKVG